MRNPIGHKTKATQGEEGYMLIAVLFLAAMILLMLSIAVPKMAADIERDREVELMHRGKQYIRGIKLYYKKFGAYPPNMEALEKSNEIRFLRKRYKDPVTGKDEWHLIHFGENKTPTAMGFFGQPMGGIGGGTMAGTGPGGMGQGGYGQSAGGSIFGNNGTSNGGAFGSSASSIGGLSNTDPTAGTGASNGTNTTGATNGSSSAPADPNNPNGGANSGSANAGGSIFASNSTGGNNQTFGGGGFIGVESTSPKLAILIYKKKTHFNEWEFVYDPMSDRMMISSNAGGVGQPMSGAGNSVATPGSGGLFNNQPGGGAIPPPQQQQFPQPQQPTTPQQ